MAARFFYFQHNLSAPRSCNITRRRGENPLVVLPDREFLKEFRMTKEEIRWLCTLLSNDLNSSGNRECDLTTEEKVLISMKTLASGSFQNCSKDFLNVSQPTVSKCLDDFVEALLTLFYTGGGVKLTRSDLNARINP